MHLVCKLRGAPVSPGSGKGLRFCVRRAARETDIVLPYSSASREYLATTSCLRAGLASWSWLAGKLASKLPVVPFLPVVLASNLQELLAS